MGPVGEGEPLRAAGQTKRGTPLSYTLGKVPRDTSHSIWFHFEKDGKIYEDLPKWLMVSLGFDRFFLKRLMVSVGFWVVFSFWILPFASPPRPEASDLEEDGRRAASQPEAQGGDGLRCGGAVGS